jgi:hypothetical protein
MKTVRLPKKVAWAAFLVLFCFTFCCQQRDTEKTAQEEVKATAQDVRELVGQAQAAYENEEYEKCGQYYVTAFEQGFSSSRAFYNAACCLSLGADADQAFLYLSKAIEQGWRNLEHLKTDSDLDGLHEDPRWSAALENCKAAEDAYLESINAELYRMYQQDQLDRQAQEIDWEVVSKRDAEHRQRVKQMLKAGELKAADDYFHAAMIFQHGKDSSDYWLAHELALETIELDSSHSSARWLAAASKDRHLQSLGKPQVYGTQYLMREGKWTLEPIDTTAVTDEERRRWNVPPLSESRRRVERMNEPNRP